MKRKMMEKLLSLIMVFTMLVSIVTALPENKLVADAAENSTLIVHYQRTDGDYTGWNLWVWNDGEAGREIKFSDEDDFGKIGIFQISKEVENFGFIVRLNEWEMKDIEVDRFATCVNGVAEIWVTEGQEEIKTQAPAGYSAYDMEAAKQEKVKEATSEGGLKVTLHYHRFDSYDGWNLWVWPKDGEGTSYEFQGEDEYGKYLTVSVPEDTSELGFIVRLNDWDAKDTDADRFFDLKNAEKDSNGAIHIYLLQNDVNVYAKREEVDLSPKFLQAYFPHNKEIVIQTTVPFDTSDESIKEKFQVLDENQVSYPIMKIWSRDLGVVNTASIIMEEKLPLSHSYTVTLEGYGEIVVSMGQAFDTEEFTSEFTYTGDDLGMTYTKEQTKLRVWAPTAAKVNVNLYSKGEGDNLIESKPMTKDINGTWVITLTGDYQGVYYTYSVTVGQETNEAVDPYARTTGVNGDRGMILDLKATNPEGFEADQKPEFVQTTDAIIYELHVRDLTSDSESNSSYPGKFLAFTETGTKNSKGLSTGLDHMKELGITHVHLLPSYDFATVDESKLDSNQFNWGYDPKNYNVPEGSYSSNPFEGEVRVKEFKQMVQSLHANGIRVVMDVVYNHTYSAVDSNFNKIVPDYYYRKDGDTFSNASGCGNETASERAMMRKFIIDSVVYWATEYHIDGFRFDLMGIHDIETMNAVREALDKVDPTILIYGEGWTASTSTLAESKRALKKFTYKLNRIAAFSDDIRDGIKGSVFNALEKGFATGATNLEESIKFGVVAATNHSQVDYSKVNYSKEFWAGEPGQSINYASAHDNMTLWDKINTSNAENSYEDKVAMNNLSAAIVLTSQGIPFFQAGEEMLRTKPSATVEGAFDENSYKSPDSTNSLKWGNKENVSEVVSYYQGLIAFRKSHASLRMTTTEEINQYLSFFDTGHENVVAYTIDAAADRVNNERLCIIYNANTEPINVTIPDGNWGVYINKEIAGTNEIATIDNGSATVDGISCMVLVQKTIPSNDSDTSIENSPAVEAVNASVKDDQVKTAIIILSIVLVLLIVGIIIIMKLRKKKQ